MSRPSARRAGFTLVELLVVILVIGILATITFGLFKAANNGRNKSKSKGEIQAISMACQSYRKAYGDFPGCLSGTEERYRRDLLDQLLGRRLLRFSTPGNPTLLAFDDATLPGANRQMRSFLSMDDVTTNDNSQIGASDWRGGNAACREFVDAWGNPYDYRYRVLTAARYAEWKSPNFLVVSCSVNFNEPAVAGEPPLLAEYWDLTASGGPGLNMTTSGIVPRSYFDESGSTGPFRADNIVNWSN